MRHPGVAKSLSDFYNSAAKPISNQTSFRFESKRPRDYQVNILEVVLVIGCRMVLPGKKWF